MPTSIAAGIESLLITPQDEYRKLGASARARIEENYTLGVVVEQYAVLYEKLVQKKGRS